MGLGTDRLLWLAQPENFESYSKLCLKIRTKEGKIEPLLLNKAQQYIHGRLEAQRKKIGKVRAIILKGRQQGCSTYIAARYYHKVTNTIGQRCFIMAHEKEATLNLFDMVSRYHENCPEQVRAIASTDNARELAFNSIQSGYKVATAGSKQSGRSQTIQLFHGSEVAFWDNAQELFAGAMQAVPEADGTEVILESTANGMGNLFYEMAMDALNTDSEYELIFVPYFWQDEYVRAIQMDFSLTDEEKEYKEQNGLTDEQINWRRNKTKELRSEWLFKQEYPTNPIEAFQIASEEVFINAESILKARKSDIDNSLSYAPLIFGVDPAWKGKDRTAIAYRKGRKCERIDILKIDNLMSLAGEIIHRIDRDQPAKVFLDVVGIGAGLYDRLCELGYNKIITAVNGGERADDVNRFYNKRAEMWGNMKDWLENELPVSIPDDDALHADLMAPMYEYDSNTRIKLEKKEDMRKRGIRSPDLADALSLTFAYPVNQNLQSKKTRVITGLKPMHRR